MPFVLCLLRHGESHWNQENRFTGWTDVDLTEEGRRQAVKGGQLLRVHGYTFDLAFTSVLRRAIRTLWHAFDELELLHTPDIKSWRLNERHYGALQGLNKAETAAKHGDEQVKIWRRSYAIPPPPLSLDDPRHPRHDGRYRHQADSELPAAESLKDTIERCLPFWHDTIAPAILDHQQVIVAAHGNSLRALCKYLDSIPDDDIVSLEIPTGLPLIYELDDDLKPIRHFYLGEELGTAPARMALVTGTSDAAWDLAPWLQHFVGGGITLARDLLVWDAADQLAAWPSPPPQQPQPSASASGGGGGAGASGAAAGERDASMADSMAVDSPREAAAVVAAVEQVPEGGGSDGPLGTQCGKAPLDGIQPDDTQTVAAAAAHWSDGLFMRLVETSTKMERVLQFKYILISGPSGGGGAAPPAASPAASGRSPGAGGRCSTQKALRMLGSRMDPAHHVLVAFVQHPRQVDAIEAAVGRNQKVLAVVHRQECVEQQPKDSSAAAHWCLRHEAQLEVVPGGSAMEADAKVLGLMLECAGWHAIIGEERVVPGRADVRG